MDAWLQQYRIASAPPLHHSNPDIGGCPLANRKEVLRPVTTTQRKAAIRGGPARDACATHTALKQSRSNSVAGLSTAGCAEI